MLIVKVPTSSPMDGSELAAEMIVGLLRQQLVNEAQMLPTFSFEEIGVEVSKQAKVLMSRLPFFVGGDDATTYGLIGSFSESYPNAGLILFDAHSNLAPDAFLGRAVGEGILRAENVAVVGVRSMQKSDLDFVRRVKLFSMKEISHEGVSEVCDSVMVAARNFGALMVCIDLDVLDPAFAPGALRLEPGGLSSRELIFCLQRIRMLKNVRAFSLTGLGSERDRLKPTAELAAKIIRESY
jgi:arginase family enzyme